MKTATEKDLVSELEQVFLEISHEWLNEHIPGAFETRNREGIFSSALTLWLMLKQRVQQRHSMGAAISELVFGSSSATMELSTSSKRLRARKISLNTGGYCQARQRLSREKVVGLSQFIASELMRRDSRRGRWGDKPIYLVDGTRIVLQHTAELLKKYPPKSNQQGESHYPQMLCVWMTNAISGVTSVPSYGANAGENADSEQALAREQFKRLPERSLIIGDRNFGVFSVAYYAAQSGHEVLFRLSENRRESILGKEVSAGDMDERVVWNATKNILKKHTEIPTGARIEGRFIKKTIERKGFRPMEISLFTTSQQPVDEIVALYKERERIENDVRTIKHVVGLEMLSGKSEDVAVKELMLGITAYNLVRSIMASASKKIGINPRELSFTRSLDLIRLVGHKIRATTDVAQRAAIVERFLVGLQQIKLPKRSKQRIEPRKVVRKDKHRFPQMKHSRDEERRFLIEGKQNSQEKNDSVAHEIFNNFSNDQVLETLTTLLK